MRGGRLPAVGRSGPVLSPDRHVIGTEKTGCTRSGRLRSVIPATRQNRRRPLLY
ncbi:hypothetical protein KPATCC21470_2536 [Kitasatospora purpeofusca]